MSGNEPKARTEYMVMVTRKNESGCRWRCVQVDTHVVPKAYYAEALGVVEVIRWAIQDESLEERYDTRARICHSIAIDDTRTVYLLRTNDRTNG